MRRITIILAALLMMVVAGYAQDGARKEYSIPEYNIKCEGVGNEGTCLVRVEAFLPKPDKGVDSGLKIAAVHGVIFKGLDSSDKCSGQPPLAKDPGVEDSNTDFFNKLFSDNANVGQYANVIEGTLRISRLNKKKYSVQAVVAVRDAELKKQLEEANVIKGFRNMF